MKRIRGVRQHDRSDCGAACLRSVARAFGLDISLSRIRVLASTGKDGTSVMGLLEAAEELGFHAKGIRGDPDSVSSVPVPSIAHIKVRNSFFHYVVITKVGRQYVRFMDPECGTIRKEEIEIFKQMWTGILVIMAPGREIRQTEAAPSLLTRILDLVKPFRLNMIQALAGTVIYSILGLSTSIFVQKIIDIVLVNRNPNLLDLLGVVMIGLLAFRMLISWFKSVLLLKTGHQVDAGLIMGYYRHLLALPQRFFDTMRTGEILSRVTDAIKIRVFINHSLIELMVALLSICVSLAAMAFLSLQLCALIGASIPLFILLYGLIDRVNRKVLRRIMEESAELESQLFESVNAQKAIGAHGWQRASEARTGEKLAGMLKSNYRAGIVSIFSSHTGESIAGLLTVLLLWAGASRVLDGSLSTGELMSFYALLGYLIGPIKSLGGLSRVFREAIVAADRLFQILDLEQEEHFDSGLNVTCIGREIRFDNVFFRYGARPELFNGLTFTIKCGEMTGIVGRSGTGKSTIASLLRADYQPSDGKLLIDNCNIGQFNKQELRKKIGIVPQHIELLSGTILENITGPGAEPETDRLVEIAAGAGLLEFINLLPSGFYTRIGENGIGLSGGEKQRIACARALYHDPEVLILDEATSGLDPQSESMFQGVIDRLRASGLTIIMITHRLSQVIRADRIILLDEGKVAETGTHADLIALKGKYRQLWSFQNPETSG